MEDGNYSFCKSDGVGGGGGGGGGGRCLETEHLFSNKSSDQNDIA